MKAQKQQVDDTTRLIREIRSLKNLLIAYWVIKFCFGVLGWILS